MIDPKTLADYLERYKDHILFQDLGAPGDKYQAFYLAVPGTRCQSCLILGTPEGVIIAGDWVPCSDPVGTISAPYKSLAWFAEASSPDYIAGKFLHKSWQADLAKKEIEETLEDWKTDWDRRCEHQADLGDKEESPNVWSEDCECEQCTRYYELKELSPDIENMSDHEFYERMSDLDYSFVEDGAPGWGFDPYQVAQLWVIHLRFQEGYREILASKSGTCPRKETLPST